jgi:hypothetical protein
MATGSWTRNQVESGNWEKRHGNNRITLISTLDTASEWRINWLKTTCFANAAQFLMLRYIISRITAITSRACACQFTYRSTTPTKPHTSPGNVPCIDTSDQFHAPVAIGSRYPYDRGLGCHHRVCGTGGYKNIAAGRGNPVIWPADGHCID